MSDTSMPAALADRMARTAHGHAAVIDGILNIRTVTDTRNAAALNALFITGTRIIPTCQDPECDCIVRLLAQMRPDIKIVAVSLEVNNG
ncbi:hypothetical protein [Pararhodobacter sp.]|uniref:hypothetical protein n=1 Tax=Pararhodobacter sp. TaxID=2127056 RepID=UPI002FDCEE83